MTPLGPQMAGILGAAGTVGGLVPGEQEVIDLGPAAWWDASYADSVTYVCAGDPEVCDVSKWTSREGSDHELVQATASKQPAFNASNSDFNDYSTLSFTKAAVSVIGNTTVYVDAVGNEGTIFLVGKCDGTPYNADRLLNWGQGNVGNLGVHYLSAAFFLYSPVISGLGTDGDEESLFMVGIVLDGDTPNSYFSLNEEANITFSAGASMTASPGETAVGAEGGNTPDWDAAEYIIFDTALNGTDFAKVETYLKNKYAGF